MKCMCDEDMRWGCVGRFDFAKSEYFWPTTGTRMVHFDDDDGQPFKQDLASEKEDIIFYLDHRRQHAHFRREHNRYLILARLNFFVVKKFLALIFRRILKIYLGCDSFTKGN